MSGSTEEFDKFENEVDKYYQKRYGMTYAQFEESERNRLYKPADYQKWFARDEWGYEETAFLMAGYEPIINDRMGCEVENLKYEEGKKIKDIFDHITTWFPRGVFAGMLVGSIEVLKLADAILQRKFPVPDAFMNAGRDKFLTVYEFNSATYTNDYPALTKQFVSIDAVHAMQQQTAEGSTIGDKREETLQMMVALMAAKYVHDYDGKRLGKPFDLKAEPIAGMLTEFRLRNGLKGVSGLSRSSIKKVIRAGGKLLNENKENKIQ